LFKRGEIIQRKIKGIQIGGAAPRGEWPFSIDVKGGRDNHIDVFDVY
jgi:hypothetical protein